MDLSGFRDHRLTGSSLVLTSEKPLLLSPLLQRQPLASPVPQARSSRGTGEEKGSFLGGRRSCGGTTKLLPLLSLQDKILPRLSVRSLPQEYFITRSNLSRASPLWPPALAQLRLLPQHGCVHHAVGWWWRSSASLRWQDGKGYGWDDVSVVGMSLGWGAEVGGCVLCLIPWCHITHG